MSTTYKTSINHKIALRDALNDILKIYLGNYEYVGEGTTVQSVISSIRIRPPELDKEAWRIQQGDYRLSAEKLDTEDFIQLAQPLDTIVPANTLLYFPDSNKELTVTLQADVGDTQIEVAEVTETLDSSEFFALGGIECIIPNAEYIPDQANNFVTNEVLTYKIRLIQWNNYLPLREATATISDFFGNPQVVILPYTETDQGVIPEQAIITLDFNYARQLYT